VTVPTGEWVELIHKCRTPSAQEIETRQAQVGSIWQCGSTDPQCSDRWKLRQIQNEPGHRGNVGTFPKWDRLTVNGEPVTERSQS
jgi:hypothetical protein